MNVVQYDISHESEAKLISVLRPPSSTYLLSIDHLARLSKLSRYTDFIIDIQNEMSEKAVAEAEKETRCQSENLLWYELRYARITASVLYRIAKCKSDGGYLVNLIIGARIPDTLAINSGRTLGNFFFFF